MGEQLAFKHREFRCLRKRRFDTAQAAREALGSLRDRALREGEGREVGLNHYRCRFCGFWHMGHWRDG